MRELAGLLLDTMESPGAAAPLRMAFHGSSPWLAGCRTAIEALPFVRRGGPGDITVTDSADGPGWHFALNGRRLTEDLREFFWHANDGSQAIELTLHSDRGVEGSLGMPPSRALDWRKHHASAIEAAPALLVVAAFRRAGFAVRPAAPAVGTLPARPAPGLASLSWFRARKSIRRALHRLPGADPTTRWSIALHPDAGEEIPDSGWRWMSGFPDHDAADPFLARHRDDLWLFFEDIVPPSGHGRLAAKPAFDAAAKPAVILEKPYHLSYPCVFEHEGDWFMIPESSANATVDLYRARRFPQEWELVKTLIEGPRLVDTTPHFHEGRWYFFTTLLLPRRGYLGLLFVADALTAPWRLHPASPLTGDAAIARAAGPIASRDGRLIRPVQDCLFRYGRSMSLREVVRLSPSAFEDRPISSILPTWHPGLSGTHTVCRAGKALALDALR